jgi:hypothetical protein
MRSFYKFFGNDGKVADKLKQISTNNIKKLEDIRVHGHLNYDVLLGRLKDSPGGFEVAFSNHAENRLAEKGEISEHWHYFINPYNFRGKWNIDTDKKIKIACFGDSFTFGDGIKQEDTYVERIREMIQDTELYNVGKGGASFERVVRTFAAFVKFLFVSFNSVISPSFTPAVSNCVCKSDFVCSNSFIFSSFINIFNLYHINLSPLTF